VNRLTVRQKILLLMTGFVIAMSAAWILAWNASRPLQEEWNNYLEQVSKREDLLMEMRAAFGYGGLIHDFKNYVLRAQAKHRQRAEASLERLSKALAGYRALANLNQSELSALKQLQDTAAIYAQQLRQVARLIADAKTPAEIDAEVKVDDSAALEAFETLFARYLALTEQQTGRINSGVAAISLVLAWVLIPSGLIGIFVMLWISRSIRLPISRFSAAIHQIREKHDLSVRVDWQRHDELGLAAAAFNGLLEQIGDIIDQVNHTANTLASEIEHFSRTAENTSLNMNEQKTQTEQIATAMNEMAATVHEVARNTESAASAATQANLASERGDQEVRQTVATIQTLANDIAQTAEVIQRLEHDSDAIGTVLVVIKNIAEQTNLLALNAAIEAARAGDQGRGFAVVADEVRTLAQRTQESTAEIQSMIERLQNGATAAVKVMGDSRAQADASVEQANNAGRALQAIIAQMRSMTDMNAQIATAAEEQSAVAEEMNRNIVAINQASDQTAATAADTAAAAERMVIEVENLTVAASRFHTSDQGIDLEAAKARHLAWKTRMRSLLDGKTNISLEQATSHRDCALGQWYYGDGLKRFGHLPQMKQLEQPHTELHALVKNIVQLKHQGQTAAAERDYQKLNSLSEKIVRLLDAIGDEIR
jgi:methyl-accepting chemotaxis protein